jgi:hypothetical protein
MTDVVVCVAPELTATVDISDKNMNVARVEQTSCIDDRLLLNALCSNEANHVISETFLNLRSHSSFSPTSGRMGLTAYGKDNDSFFHDQPFSMIENRLLGMEVMEIVGAEIDGRETAMSIDDSVLTRVQSSVDPCVLVSCNVLIGGDDTEKPDAWPNVSSILNNVICIDEESTRMTFPSGDRNRQGSAYPVSNVNPIGKSIPIDTSDITPVDVSLVNKDLLSELGSFMFYEPIVPFDPGGDLNNLGQACGNAASDVSVNHCVSPVDNLINSNNTIPTHFIKVSRAKPSSSKHKLVTISEDIILSDYVMKWITDNEVDQQIADMGVLADGGRRLPSEICWGEGQVNIKEVMMWDNEAKIIMEEPLVSGDFSDNDLDMSMVLRDSKAVKSFGLAETLNERIKSIRYRGLDRKDFVDSLESYPLAPNLLDLMDHGQRAFMKPNFKPNGGLRFKQSKSYKQYTALCNRHLFKLQAEGDAIIIEAEAITPLEMAQSHYSSVVLAASSNPNKEGRCCINLGYKAQGPRNDRNNRLISFNDGYDCVESDKWYPPTKLPDVRDICELACIKKAKFEKIEPLSSATMDVYKAYRQVVADLQTTMLTSIMIEVNGKQYMVYTHVGFFGHTRTGHAYNVIGSFIDYKHNLWYSRRHPQSLYNRVSVTYIDDSILIDGESLIEEDRDELRCTIKNILGDESVPSAKDVLHGTNLLAIGWSFNLEYSVWRVSPKPRAIIKIYAAVFHVFQKNFCDEDVVVKVSRRKLLSVASLLSWYSVGLKLGNAFVHSLYKSAGWGDMDSLKVVSLNSKRDIGWWRVLSIASMRNPWFLSTDISSLRKNKVPTIFVCGDACTGIGGGGWLGTSKDEASAGNDAFIRWSPKELKAFEQFKVDNDGKPVDINVLEYFVIVYLILLWGPKLKGQIVNIQCDNTSAVSWLQKMRASNKSPISETLNQIFSLYCIAIDVTLDTEHLRGELNKKSDELSRSRLLKSIQEYNTEIEDRLDLKDERWWIGQSREAICRNLLLASIVMPWTVPSRLTLELLKVLL